MKRIISSIKKKESIFYIICFFLLLFSFHSNLFKIIPDNMYHKYEIFVESLVVGRMVKADKDGLFSASGFDGVNYDKKLLPDSIANGDYINNLTVRDYIISHFEGEQIKYYLNEKEAPEDYCVYVSQSGGQAVFYYLIQKVLPFDQQTKYQILRFINCALLALCFMLFVAWAYRNFGFVSALVCFIFVFLSSWIVLFGGNGLWWSLWSFYIPFLTVLLLMEKKHSNPESITYRKILVYIFIAFIVKMFFTGLEFMTTIMLTIFIPIVYYFWIERRSIIEFLKFSFQAGVVALLAVAIQFGVLILQLRDLLGTFNQATQYLIDSFVRRSSFNTGLTGYDQGDRFQDSDSLSFIWNNVVKDYLRGDVFYWGFLPSNFQFFFAYLIGAILFFSIVLLIFCRKSKDRKYQALVFSTLLSAACPLSWFVIFKEHAFWHPQIDFIIWYMPFLLLGFILLGAGISCLLPKKNNMLNR